MATDVSKTHMPVRSTLGQAADFGRARLLPSRVIHTPDLPGMVAVAVWLLLCGARFAESAEPEPTEAALRAVTFLIEEVPAWPKDNNCFSCHNNGDGARALLFARQRGFDVPESALVETTGWLVAPDKWERISDNSDYNDRRLITVQFSAALAALTDATADRTDAKATSALMTAARTLSELQFEDGSWAFEAEGQIGSPIGYGRPLMTVIARNVLHRADPDLFATHITRANNWLQQAEPRTVLDTAAVLWGLSADAGPRLTVRQAMLLELIRRSQSPRGGWGPYEISSPEPFDTAVVLLALHQIPPTDDLQRMIASGRKFLADTQLASGAWRATTRPSGVESYPQKLSTTAWATLALLATQ